MTVPALFPAGLPQAPEAPAFPPTSRYSGLPLLTVELDGRQVRCVSRRFVPPPERFALLREHPVADGERPDTLAAAELGDPERFWLLCDANGVLDPAELTADVGRRLRITLPEGVPGAADA
ncbi:LysM domain-containing protein [Kitasatospora sp. CM 4170]|uniref:LysM domain-containing protein n=1 Tax=Kitasatospora aburaviensis TaxID=67265 RepID=A0ABW1ERH0_9ACTN|nr:LysM domain-containing protein [Kitasatospora sp. CM 4170]WNM44448.1 LysM domain-containing protein [Kitasatospora sp. CM 4170]